MARLLEKYKNEIVPAMMKDYSYENVMQVPKLKKIVINIGLGEALQNAKAVDAATADLRKITGQQPVVTRAKKSISNFKLREGMVIGCKVTIRGKRMYEFYDRFVNVVLPRVRDFKGINPRSFDKFGNFAMGLQEQLVFPEIEYDQIDKLRGMDIVVVTSANNTDEAKSLLSYLGMPFRK